ncbi:MAG: hypothetical protein ACRDCW_02535 [Sarcina sp.]
MIAGNVHNSILFSISTLILAIVECFTLLFGLCGVILLFEMAKDEFDK